MKILSGESFIQKIESKIAIVTIIERIEDEHKILLNFNDDF